MHTFSRQKDGTYAVGIWLASAFEYRFIALFHVTDIANAMLAVTQLNGSPDATPFNILKFEPPTKKLVVMPWWAGFLLGIMLSIAFRLGAH